MEQIEVFVETILISWLYLSTGSTETLYESLSTT